MSKYTITITEAIPSSLPPLERRLRRAPSHFYDDILKLETDQDLTAEIANLVKSAKVTPEVQDNE